MPYNLHNTNTNAYKYVSYVNLYSWFCEVPEDGLLRAETCCSMCNIQQICIFYLTWCTVLVIYRHFNTRLRKLRHVSVNLIIIESTRMQLERNVKVSEREM